MKQFGNISLLHIRLVFDTLVPPLAIGRLAWSQRHRTSVFEYDNDFLATGLELSPYHLKRTAQPITARPDPFEGIFGLFADSLPDGWGRRLTDRRLAQDGIDPGSLSPVDRLALIGRSGMGALAYEPDRSGAQGDLNPVSLDELYGDAARADRDQDVTDLSRLERLNGGSTGARPKAMIHIGMDDTIHAAEGSDRIAWIVKFASRSDDTDIGAVEAAYAAMAKQAGITMPQTRFFPAETGRATAGYFGAKRFDRDGSKRHHIHTAAGILHADHRIPTMTYEDLITLTRQITRDQAEVDEQFRRAVFNALAGNRDDHARNHAFLFDLDAKRYRLAPAYDITPSDGMAGEHALTSNGRGKDIGPADIEALAGHAGLPPKRARTIIDQVVSAIQSWPAIADAFPLTKARRLSISSRLNRGIAPFGGRIK